MWPVSSHRKRWLFQPVDLAKRRRVAEASPGGRASAPALVSVLCAVADRLGFGAGAAATAAVLLQRRLLFPTEPAQVGAVLCSCLSLAAERQVKQHRDLEVFAAAVQKAVVREVDGQQLPVASAAAIRSEKERLVRLTDGDLDVVSPFDTLLVLAQEAAACGCTLDATAELLRTARHEVIRLLCTDAALLHAPQRIAVCAFCSAAAAHGQPRMVTLPLLRSMLWGRDAADLLSASALATLSLPPLRCTQRGGTPPLAGGESPPLAAVGAFLPLRDAAAAQCVCVGWRDVLKRTVWARASRCIEQQERCVGEFTCAEVRLLRHAALQFRHARTVAVTARSLSAGAAGVLARLIEAAAATPDVAVVLRGLYAEGSGAEMLAAALDKLPALRRQLHDCVIE